MPEHVDSRFGCRPGITGAATIAFAHEERVLDRVPRHELNAFYHLVVLPAKRRLDAEYMSHATFRSDLKMIYDSVLRRWDSSFVDGLLDDGRFDTENAAPFLALPEKPIPVYASHSMPMNHGLDTSDTGEQASA
jgi:hypothetical protein